LWSEFSSHTFYQKGDVSMNFLTNLIFVLNLLKTLINHFF